MARIYDYNNFSSSSGNREDYEFRYKLDYLSTNLMNEPDEFKELITSSCEIRYRAKVKSDKNGITDMDFEVIDIELRLEIDDYPNETIIEEMEIKPGVNISPDKIKIIKGEKLIPSYPTIVYIDMAKGGNVGQFSIEVQFGED